MAAGRGIVSGRLVTIRKRRCQAKESALFMAILILKWYLMSHQARTDLSELGYTGRARRCSHPTVLCRTCYCRTYSYVCFCASVLPLPGTPIPHWSTNDGVELPDGTPRGVRDLYPVWLPWFSAPPRPPSFFVLHVVPLAHSLTRSPANVWVRGSCRTVAPATKMFCETNVCIRTLDRPRNPIGPGGDDNRR